MSDTEAAPKTDAEQMLLDFLRGHDAACPVCGYNLRALTRPVCPECGHDLVLTVGTTRLHMGWLFAALAPGFFSGIAACFVLIPIIGRLGFGDGRWSPGLNVLDIFGWCSGIFAILLARRRVWFIKQSIAFQRWCALGIWLVHVAALGLFIFVGLRFL